jgi:hypothetical protein
MRVSWNNLNIPQEMTTSYRWGDEEVDYAADIFFGDDSTPRGEQPGRDWIEPALQAVQPVEFFASACGPDLQFVRGFHTLSLALFDAFEDAITGDNFAWPRRTRRSDGRVVDSPRNIVDTGAFQDSQSMSIEVR